MSRRWISTENAPQPVGPYTQAIVANGFVFCSGQIALDPSSGELVRGGIATQTAQVLMNLRMVLISAGSTLSHIVKATVYLKSLEDFEDMNEIYGVVLGPNPPARTTIGKIDLPRGALVEMEVIAVVRDDIDE